MSIKSTEVFVDANLVKFLKQSNPPLEIGPGTDSATIMFESGKQAVIKQLENLLAKQEK